MVCTMRHLLILKVPGGYLMVPYRYTEHDFSESDLAWFRHPIGA